MFAHVQSMVINVNINDILKILFIYMYLPINPDFELGSE